MYHQFNIDNSTFCPHSVFMCFVWISEQTAIISLYNINWLDFITERECVYCAVRTGSLHSAYVRSFQCYNTQHTVLLLPQCNTNAVPAVSGNAWCVSCRDADCACVSRTDSLLCLRWCVSATRSVLHVTTNGPPERLCYRVVGRGKIRGDQMRC